MHSNENYLKCTINILPYGHFGSNCPFVLLPIIIYIIVYIPVFSCFLYFILVYWLWLTCTFVLCKIQLILESKYHICATVLILLLTELYILFPKTGLINCCLVLQLGGEVHALYCIIHGGYWSTEWYTYLVLFFIIIIIIFSVLVEHNFPN